jgi:hypothetical protein
MVRDLYDGLQRRRDRFKRGSSRYTPSLDADMSPEELVMVKEGRLSIVDNPCGNYPLKATPVSRPGVDLDSIETLNSTRRKLQS